MPLFDVVGSVHASKYLGRYEAATEEEAINMALRKQGGVCICHQCNDECSDPEIVSCTAEVVNE